MATTQRFGLDEAEALGFDSEKKFLPKNKF